MGNATDLLHTFTDQTTDIVSGRPFALHSRVSGEDQLFWLQFINPFLQTALSPNSSGPMPSIGDSLPCKTK